MACWGDYKKYVSIEHLVGQTIKSVIGLNKDSEEVLITTVEGNQYNLYHEQDCCEHVWLADYEGEGIDIIGGLVISAEEVTSGAIEGEEVYESGTWTFYKIETSKGGIWMRWLGESNGYYSEGVNVMWVNKPE